MGTAALRPDVAEDNRLSLFTSVGEGMFFGSVAAVLTHLIPGMVGTISLVLMFNLVGRWFRGWKELGCMGGIAGAFIAYFAVYEIVTADSGGGLTKVLLSGLVIVGLALFCGVLVSGIMRTRNNVIARAESVPSDVVDARPFAATESWEEPYFAELRARTVTGRRPSLPLARSGMWCALALIASVVVYTWFDNSVLLAVASSVFLFQSIVLARELRYLVRLRHSDVLVDDDRGAAQNPVLLLRPFDVDEFPVDPVRSGWAGMIGMLAVSDRSFEEVLAHMFEEVGPLVAIGRPGEEATPLGAVRTYAGDDSWRTTVLEAAASARLVILVMDTTAGVEWELENVPARVGLQRLVILPPPGDDADGAESRRQRWAPVRERFPAVPELTRDVAGVCFDADDEPIVVTTHGATTEEQLTSVKEAWLAARR